LSDVEAKESVDCRFFLMHNEPSMVTVSATHRKPTRLHQASWALLVMIGVGAAARVANCQDANPLMRPTLHREEVGAARVLLAPALTDAHANVAGCGACEISNRSRAVSMYPIGRVTSDSRSNFWSDNGGAVGAIVGLVVGAGVGLALMKQHAAHCSGRECEGPVSSADAKYLFGSVLVGTGLGWFIGSRAK
jgi:hypothetical protein